MSQFGSRARAFFDRAFPERQIYHRSGGTVRYVSLSPGKQALLALSAVGCVLIILLKDSTIAFYGAILSAAAITALFFGQRIAKDYAGAAVLVPYFLLTLLAIYLLAQQ